MGNTSVGFVGVILAGELGVRSDGAIGRQFNANKVLGAGFVVDPHKGLIVTCDHVLPTVDRNSDQLFAFYTLNPDGGFLVHLIDRNFCAQWESHDLIALRISPSSSLITYEFHEAELELGSQAIAVGFPIDHHKSTATNSHVVVRGFTGFVVSGYDIEYEMDTQVIVTMSGCPVLYQNKIVGVAHSNRQYSRELITEETVEVAEVTGTKRTETYSYNEVLKLGVFFKASAFLGWLRGVMASS